MSILLIEDNNLWSNFTINNISFDVDLCSSFQSFLETSKNVKKRYEAAIIDLFIPFYKDNHLLKENFSSTYGNGIGFYLKYINPDIADIIIGNSMDFEKLKTNFFNYTLDKSLFYDSKKNKINIDYIKNLENIILNKEKNNKWRFL